MARVTVEDCLEVMPNRFELSVLSGFRAKQISRGAPAQIDIINDKSSVVALKEIAERCHDVEFLRRAYITSLRSTINIDDVSHHEDHSTIEDMNMIQIEDHAALKDQVDSEEDDDGNIMVENYESDDELDDK